MLTQTQIKQYLKNWGIDNNVEIHPTFIAGGRKISNNAWSIDDKYIFKTGKNIAGLKTHIYISNALTDLGIESSYPTATRDGKGFIIDEERYFILLNKIKGQPLTNEERFKGNRLEIGKKYGEAIGNLHKAFLLQDDNLEVDNTDMLNLMLRWALPETKKILEQWGCLLPEEFYKDYIEYISNYFDKLPKQIIHRDPNPSNILFKDNEVTGFIDFEISERNVRIIDPCYCATGILSETDDIERDFNYWIEILDGIIMGYDNICSLTEIEKQSIPYIIYSIQMIFIAWLNGKEEYKNLAIKNRNILLKIFKYFQNKNTI